MLIFKVTPLMTVNEWVALTINYNKIISLKSPNLNKNGETTTSLSSMIKNIQTGSSKIENYKLVKSDISKRDRDNSSTDSSPNEVKHLQKNKQPKSGTNKRIVF